MFYYTTKERTFIVLNLYLKIDSMVFDLIALLPDRYGWKPILKSQLETNPHGNHGTNQTIRTKTHLQQEYPVDLHHLFTEVVGVFVFKIF